MPDPLAPVRTSQPLGASAYRRGRADLTVALALDGIGAVPLLDQIVEGQPRQRSQVTVAEQAARELIVDRPPRAVAGNGAAEVGMAVGDVESDESPVLAERALVLFSGG